MTRELNRLTTGDVQNVKTTDNATGPRLIGDGGGLWLQVMPSGSKSWLFRYTLAGIPKTMGLGPLHTISLHEARDEATKLRKLVARGLDPRLERDRQAREQVLARERTFRSCAEEYIAGLEGAHKSKKAHKQWSTSLETYAYPVIGDLPVADIDVHMIRTLLTRHDYWRTKNDTMARVRGRIERILGWCHVLGYRSGENPARFRNFLSEVLPSRRSTGRVRHHPAMPYSEVPSFVARMRSEPRTMSRLCLEFLILTGTRTGEVIGARWVEFDTDLSVWTIPPQRMKSGRVHRVPLSGAARELLEGLRSLQQDFVFPGLRRGKHLSNMAMLEYMRERVGTTAVPHGFRSSFRDWCTDQTDYPREIAEAALAHVVADRTEAAYRRGDALEKRRRLMEDWAGYCASMSPRETSVTL